MVRFLTSSQILHEQKKSIAMQCHVGTGFNLSCGSCPIAVHLLQGRYMTLAHPFFVLILCTWCKGTDVDIIRFPDINQTKTNKEVLIKCNNGVGHAITSHNFIRYTWSKHILHNELLQALAVAEILIGVASL